LCALIGTWYY